MILLDNYYKKNMIENFSIKLYAINTSKLNPFTNSIPIKLLTYVGSELWNTL